MDEPVDFLRVPMAGGGTMTLLTRLTDGRVMCQLCFDYFHLADLNPVEGGKVEDVCKQCAAEEMRELAERQ